MKNQKTVFYESEQTDEFSGISRNTLQIESDFPFCNDGIFWRIAEFFVYRVLMKPVAFLWCKLKFGMRFENRKVLKDFRDRGYFLYSNHTLMAGDAFVPNLVDTRKRTYVVVHPDNISIKGMKNFILMCGAIPLPTSMSGFRAFCEAIKRRSREGGIICIYPEAHIWPYFTGIRDFSDSSFAYPVKCDSPVFCSTVTYQKRRFTSVPRVTVYIDGPFYPDKELGLRAAQKKLCEEVKQTMKDRAKNSTYERIRYVKKESEENE